MFKRFISVGYRGENSSRHGEPTDVTQVCPWESRGEGRRARRFQTAANFNKSFGQSDIVVPEPSCPLEEPYIYRGGWALHPCSTCHWQHLVGVGGHYIPAVPNQWLGAAQESLASAHM